MFLTLLTEGHVALSLVGIASGCVVLFGLFTGRRLDGWNALFLLSTVATSVTGFLFPRDHFMPAHAVGIFSLLILGVAIYARYPRNLQGVWRRVYAVTAVISLYLNVFVGVVQSFLHIPVLKRWAPKQTEPPFFIAQLFFLVLFIVLTFVAAAKSRERLAGAAVLP